MEGDGEITIRVEEAEKYAIIDIYRHRKGNAQIGMEKSILIPDLQPRKEAGDLVFRWPKE